MVTALTVRHLFMEDSDMKKSIIILLRRILFLAVLVFSLYQINILLMPKYSYSNSDWPTTATFEEFYDMEKNSIDVLFFGSSVAASAFNPQEIYDHNRIRSYNLASEQQSLFLSYYWLKEALSYQSPKVVVTDLKFLFPVHPESPINTTEPITRKSLDVMRYSMVKAEAVRNLCALDKTQTALSYYLTNIRFHSRWSTLDEQDFTPADYTRSPLKGYAPLSYRGPKDFTPTQFTGSLDTAYCDPLMLDYLGRMDALCKERGIQLVLTNMAEEGFSEEEHNTIRKFADEHGDLLYDFSEESTYERVGAQLRMENIVDHPNLWGSEKLSRFMADELQQTCHVTGVDDSQWEESIPFYEHIKKTCYLMQTDDLKEFMTLINDPDYTVMIVAARDGAGTADDNVRKGMEAMGLNDISGFANQSYIAVVNPDSEPLELYGDEPLSYSCSLGEGRSVCSLESAGLNSGGRCCVTIDGKNVVESDTGLHILVYDNIQKKIIDIREAK